MKFYPHFHFVLSLVKILLIIKTGSKTIKVLTTTEDVTKFTDGSGARLRNPPDVQLVDVTVCLRFYQFLLIINTLISSEYEHEIQRPIFSILDQTSSSPSV